MVYRNDTSPQKLSAAERKAQVLKLRAEGKTYEQIAATLGCSVGTAHGDVTAALDKLAAEETTEARRLRAMERVYLDEVWAAIAPAALGGHLLTVDRAVKVRESYRKLLGLDAPVRQEIGGLGGGPLAVDMDVDLTHYSDDELRALANSGED